MDKLVTLAPALGILGLLFAGMLYWGIMRRSPGTDRMREISDSIHEGAMAFLRREYSILFAFVGIVAVLLGVFLNWQTAVAFISGAACSILAGFIGMKAATRANVRTTAAAKDRPQEERTEC